MIKKNKILVTGGNGLLGSEIVNILKKKKIKNFHPSSEKLNFTCYRKVDDYFKKKKPTHVIHSANKVYGIGGNFKKKFETINENMIINSNLLKACKKHKIKKIICIGSAAIYSEKYKNNIKEKNALKQKPHISEFYYGISKRVMLHQLRALSEQTNINFCYIIMNNLYGKNDNFNKDHGHVVPSLIHKFYLAKKNNSRVQLWGSPKTKRCLLYAKDAARMILQIMNKKIEIINLSAKNEISIGELAKLISKIYNFKGQIQWERKKFKGVDRRKLDLSLLNRFKIKEKYSLSTGLFETIEWFTKNYKYIIRK